VKKSVILIFCSISLFACQSSNVLTVKNDYSFPIKINFSTPFNIDTTTYCVLPTQDSQIQSNAFTSVSSDKDIELRTIIIRDSTSNKYIVLRFSNSYFEFKRWELRIPFSIPKNVRFQKLGPIDKARALDSHGYYYGVQELYNAGRYSECLDAIEDVILLLNADVAEIRQKLLQGLIQKYQIEMNEMIAENFNFLLLAYLCAQKTNNRNKANQYWKDLIFFDRYRIEYLQENDFELSKYRAG
jgi:hypothetical protein